MARDVKLAKKGAMFMRFRYAFSFESDLKPVHTVRGELIRDDYESAFKSAVFLAAKEAPRGKYRSFVCVIETLDDAGSGTTATPMPDVTLTA
jgi:hypothetical protein